MNEDLLKLAEDYWEACLDWEPTLATYLGDFRYNDRLPEIGAEARERRLEEIQALQQRLEKIQPEDEQDRISWDILRLNLESAQEEERHGFYQWNLDQLAGPQVWLLELTNYHPLATEQDYQDLATRYRAFRSHIDEYISNLKEGLKTGRTSPRIVVDRVIGQIEDILATPPEKSSLIPPPNEAIPKAIRDDLNKAAFFYSVYPSYQRLLDFLKTYPSRAEVGLCALPGGDEAYRFRIRHHTTTTMTAEEIHQMGLDNVRAIKMQMEEIARKTGHAGSLATFREKLKNDASLYNTSREDLLDGYRKILDEVTALLPRHFGRLPGSERVVKPIEDFREKDCVAAYYYGPPEDFSTARDFDANTYAPETDRYTMTALTVHEAVPCHHLQIALAMELGELPRFRRHGMFTAYVEGWALYTERLGVEMGVYHDDLSLFGMLTYQIWRASRLVVDTGMHAKGWTRQQAIDFFLENVGLPEGETVNEIDRYIMWPGQALAYAVGMREILNLREEATARLGDRFDLSGFHDEVLRFGALPLSTLRTLIEAWVERNQTAGTRT